MMRGPRDMQEDCIVDGVRVYQADWLEEKREINADRILLVVCDGMGGHAEGEAASRFVCEQLKQECLEQTFSLEAVEGTLSRIQESAKQKLPENCGTTVAGLMAMENRVMIFNAGDSRVYKITRENITCLSHDHSLVQGLVDKALIHQDTASLHPFKNFIEFGIGPAFTDAWRDYQVHTHHEAVSLNACYLLCSDGLSDLMTEQALLECLSPSPMDKGTALLQLVREKGPVDNTSFIIAQIR